MLNSAEFIKRLEILMDQYDMTPSLFAEKIGVQRSSISHLLSGRNKPSLDFVLKLLDVFPDVNLYWLLNGDDSYLKAEISSNHSTQENIKEISAEENISTQLINKIKNEPEISKIIMFYNDGTFTEFKAK